MNIKNEGQCGQLRSENRLEADALFTASMASYSPRAAAIAPNDDRVLILGQSEAEEFAAGVLRDERLGKRDKWAICKLIACWLSGEITDEGTA